MIFICAGLGGGTGSGAAPVIAEIARESGALVITFATMPFAFEGKRRLAQAQEALARLHEVSDAVICFENDLMGDIVAPKAGIHQAFAAADVTISQSVRAIVSLMQRPGLIRIGFDDLLAALRGGPNARCLFGYGESDSDNRAHDALTQALKNPLMDRGRLLSDAANVLVQVAGGPGMTLSEVEALMQDLGRHIDDRTQILFGTSVDGRMGNRLAVTLISSLAAEGETARKPLYERPAAAAPPRPAPVVEPKPEPPAAAPVEEDEEFVAEQESPPVLPAFETPPRDDSTADRGAGRYRIARARGGNAAGDNRTRAAAAAGDPAKKKPVVLKEVKPPVEKIVQAKQEVLQFESVTRGRFEKSEPTIVEGQDLDVPTFLRKNVRVKVTFTGPTAQQNVRRHFFIKSSTAEVIAIMPVRIVGSGTGANLLECRLGSGAAPGFRLSAYFAGSTAPTLNMQAGIE